MEPPHKRGGIGLGLRGYALAGEQVANEAIEIARAPGRIGDLWRWVIDGRLEGPPGGPLVADGRPIGFGVGGVRNGRRIPRVEGSPSNPVGEVPGDLLGELRGVGGHLVAVVVGQRPDQHALLRFARHDRRPRVAPGPQRLPPVEGQAPLLLAVAVVTALAVLHEHRPDLRLEERGLAIVATSGDGAGRQQKAEGRTELGMNRWHDGEAAPVEAGR